MNSLDGTKGWEEVLGPVRRVATATLLPSDSPRRAGEDPDHIEVLSGFEETLPPITVHYPSMRVIDGMHRLRAALLRGDTEIDARFFEGPSDDAFILAVRANIGHGLPLSAGDRRAAAIRILASHPQWSDRAIASVAGLAPKTVSVLRHDRTEAGPVAAGPDSRIGRDGRVRPVDSSEGRRVAGRLIADNPEASLREIAGKSGISPGTVRDVRARIRRGEDPVPPKRSARPRKPSSGGEDNVRSLTADDPAAVFRMLYRDPSLRLTENGRLLLRLLEVHTLGGEQWEKIIISLPPHCIGSVSAAAVACAEAWQDFATRIERHECA